MTFKRKFYLSLFAFCLLSSFVYSLLINYHVASHKIKGRIINVEKKFLFDKWKLVLFSDGDIYEIDIEREEDVAKLKTYDEKFILINYSEYFIRGPVGLKYRLETWQKVISTKKVNDIRDKILESIDKNLTCSFLAQLQNDENLNDQVIVYLEEKKIDVQSVLKKCGL